MERKEQHYSNKGGYKERSEFWRGVRTLASITGYSPTKELIWLVRRNMPRYPKDGRR